MSHLEVKGAPLLAAAAEKKLLAKLAKTEDADAIAKVLAKAAPGGAIEPLLADLARRQKLTLQDGLVELMQRVAGDLEPSAIHAFFDTFGEECAGEPPSDFPVLRGFGQNELLILASSYAKHPDYWDEASLSKVLEGALALVRARSGKDVDAALRERLLDELATGVLSFADLPDNAYHLGITPEEWGRKTLPFVLGAELRMMVKPATVEALVQAPWDDVKRILRRTPFHGPSFVQILTRRTDDPKEVLAFGEALLKKFEDAAECGFLDMAVLRRIAPAGLPLPETWDEELAGTVVYFSGDRNGFAESFAGAERSISVERRHQIIRSALKSYDDDGKGHFAYALLRHAWDEGLFAEALAGLKDNEHLTISVYHEESESLGLVGARALPTLVEEFGIAKRTPQTGVASALWHSVLIAAAATAEAGELAQSYIDVLIDPGYKIGPQAYFYCWRYWQKLLRALSPARREAIVASWKATHPQGSWEGCIPDELRPRYAPSSRPR